MKLKRLASILLLALLVFPTAARADVIMPGMKPPRNEQSEAFVKLYGTAAWDSAYNSAFDGVSEIVLWRYPNSGEKTGTLFTDWFQRDSLSEQLTPCYLDGQGRFWGYINYAYGSKKSWVCLSDPANQSIPADSAVVSAVDREVAVMLIGENFPAILLVGAVVVTTGVLLYIFWVKKRKSVS